MKEFLPQNNTSRKIIHLDMDAFYAAVEMQENPTLKKKALVVGHDPRKYHGHGVVATANYEARKYGVHSAMPTAKALKLVPKEKLVFVSPNFTKYRAISKQIHALMYQVTDQVESIALDEAYLDVTENKLKKPALQVASWLQQKIYQEIGLTSSFGVTYNKFLAKMASEYAKPFGRTVILPEDALEFLEQQPIEKFPGIGKKTQQQLHDLNIYTGKDLQNASVLFLMEKFKKLGYAMALHAHGIDLTPVKKDRLRKSLGTERTFDPIIYDKNQALTILRGFCENLSEKLVAQNLQAQVVVLKIRNNDFETLTKRRQLAKPSNNGIEFYQTVKSLLDKTDNFFTNGVRLLGVTAGTLVNKKFEEVKLDLF
ncbi:DNA polymerase IV [Lactobacillus sp. PV012]|uniref:DNA polymerase IV n=1 Tax=Lactobacillus sp. PV012 TaxID=2594494 RepID=UPI0022400F61|nr:DNA polymerase IV [Lactobacillus sp. PV012]QNQ81907.1 DNA polymerase IV [Lactobacillus sp. PV012]